MNNSTAEAWITQSNGHWLAIGAYELKMLVKDSHIIGVSGAPRHCHELLLLEDKLFPLLDMAHLLDEQKSADNHVIGLLTYFEPTQEKTLYGAMRFDTTPQKIIVSDDLEVGLDKLDTADEALKPFLKTAFSYQEKTIGVLDVDKVFNYQVPAKGK